MAEQITLTVTEAEKAEIDDLARSRGVSIDELFRQALHDLASRSGFASRFHLLHDRMVPHAEALGIRSDQDVFDQVS